MTLYQTISSEFDRLGMVRIPNALERLSVSLGCHLFNLANLDNKNFYNGGDLENFRVPVVFMAPSGYGKSKMLGFFLKPKTGILAHSGIPSSIEGTFSTEAWMGTIQNGEEQPGVLQRYKRGIVGADEFMKLGRLMAGNGENHDEVYIMQALDSNTVKKNLAYGEMKIEGLGFSMWAGMRMEPLALESGMARRFSFQIFCPTINDSVEFRTAMRSKSMKSAIPEETKESIAADVIDIMRVAGTMTDLDYTPIEDWVDKHKDDIPHFEETLYMRMGVGWAAINGYLPDIKMDPLLDQLLTDELRTRAIIRADPRMESYLHVIRSTSEGKIEQKHLIKFLEKNYQQTKIQVVNDLRSLRDAELIRTEDGWVSCITPEEFI